MSKDIPPDIMKDIDEPIMPFEIPAEELGNVANKLSHIPTRNCARSNARMTPKEIRSKAILFRIRAWLV